MTIGNNIKRMRKSKGLTQKDLANRLNVTAAMISQYENNSNPPKIDTLEKIAAALNTNIFELIDEESVAESYINHLESNKNNTFIEAFGSLLYSRGFLLILLKHDPKHAILQHRLHQNVKYLIEVTDFSNLLDSIGDYFDYKLQNFIDSSERLTEEQYNDLENSDAIEKILT